MSTARPRQGRAERTVLSVSSRLPRRRSRCQEQLLSQDWWLVRAHGRALVWPRGGWCLLTPKSSSAAREGTSFSQRGLLRRAAPSSALWI